MTAYEKVASAGDLAPGEAMRVHAGGQTLALFNVEGDYYAIDEWCPHETGPLSGGYMDGNIVMCPFHLADFDVTTGRVLSPPATRDVGAYAVRRTGDDIDVEV